MYCASLCSLYDYRKWLEANEHVHGGVERYGSQIAKNNQWMEKKNNIFFNTLNERNYWS